MFYLRDIHDDQFILNVEDKIGNQFYESIGEPEEMQENPEISSFPIKKIT